MSRLRRQRAAMVPGRWRRWCNRAGVAVLVLRLAGHFAAGEPWSIDWVSDSDAGLLCKIVYRDPHTAARENAPPT